MVATAGLPSHSALRRAPFGALRIVLTVSAKAHHLSIITLPIHVRYHGQSISAAMSHTVQGYSATPAAIAGVMPLPRLLWGLAKL